jgi:organic radical activating enzyme
MSVDALIDLFLIDSSLDGITITGGEPLDQYQVVKCVCEKIYPSTSVFLTTGYTLRQIMEKGYTDILNCVDILCSGPFDPKRITSNEWRGSTNQGINYLTKRGLELADRSVVSKEFFINAHGDVLKTGFTN